MERIEGLAKVHLGRAVSLPLFNYKTLPLEERKKLFEAINVIIAGRGITHVTKFSLYSWIHEVCKTDFKFVVENCGSVMLSEVLQINVPESKFSIDTICKNSNLNENATNWSHMWFKYIIKYGASHDNDLLLEMKQFIKTKKIKNKIPFDMLSYLYGEAVAKIACE